MTSLTSQTPNQLASFSAIEGDSVVILTIQQPHKKNVLDVHFSDVILPFGGK